VDPDKFTKGLGCHEIALCGPDEDAASLGAKAARRALERWGGDLGRIGLLAVGTETGADMSRPMSAFVADHLELRGRMRSYEVKHACYGGTVALRQALEWRASGAHRDRAALVIATDVGLYAPADPGEATQGAGAVAFVLDEDPSVASIDLESHAFASPAFDFWRPVGERFPRVEGPLSLDCYREAVEKTFGAWAGERSVQEALEALDAVAFHVPFPKMVKKAVMHLGATQGWAEGDTATFFETKVAPTMQWNRHMGNSYTAALWWAVACALVGRKAGSALGAFSYGSGFGSELSIVRAGRDAADAVWQKDVDDDLKSRVRMDAAEYDAWRGSV
jgi:hydroxymethylglutaryl-CoA synthase